MTNEDNNDNERFSKEYNDRAFYDRWGFANPDFSYGLNAKEEQHNNQEQNINDYKKENEQDEENKINQKIPNKNYFEYLVNSIKKTVKCEDVLIRQILYTGLSTYVEDDPLNLGILAPTSEGKTYAIVESLKYFPDEDIMYVGQMSPKVLVRQRGILIHKNDNQPINEKIQELSKKINELKKQKLVVKDKEVKAVIDEEIEKIDDDIRKQYEDSKTLIDLRGKILVFLEPPQYELWNLLKPILSHDKKEIQFDFVNNTERTGHVTKNVVVRGFPSCIFCSAKDESKWEIWQEIKSRILVTSPNMIPQKYQESKQLISLRYGKPNIIQEQLIISNEEIELTKKCVMLIKHKIKELKTRNKNGKISMWIPYADLLQRELPNNKGTDVRYAKRIFSSLNIVPIVKFNLRKLLILEAETIVIADIEDLKEVLSLNQNFEGLPKFKTDFFNEIFCPCFESKTQVDIKDEYSNNEKREDIKAVTTRELCEFFKEKKGKPISTDNLKKTYLNQLINEEIIDYTQSKINTRHYIYYPVSSPSNLTLIDDISQESLPMYEKIMKNITQGWIFHEIMGLLSYRLRQGNIALIDYIKNKEKFQLLEGDNNNCNGSNSKEISLGEFVKIYQYTSIRIDDKPSPILLDFGKTSQCLSILGKIDQIDKEDE